MSMPQIPEEKHRPCLKETVIDLLESIALEEIALSHLVNAEAEKIQTFLYTIRNYSHCHSEEEFVKFNTSTARIIDTVIMKEWILLKKLEDVLEIDYKPHKENDSKDDHDCKHHHHKEHHHHDDCDKEDDKCVEVKIKCHCDRKICDHIGKDEHEWCF